MLDADVYGHSIPHMLGVQQRPVVVDTMIVPPVRGDLKLMSIGFFLDDNAPVMWRGPMLHRALEQFLSDVYWGELDTLVVDMPPGTGDVAISLGQLLPRAEVVIVTTPQPAAQQVAVRAAVMAEKVGMRIVGVVENMSYLVGTGQEIFGSGGGQRARRRDRGAAARQRPARPGAARGGRRGHADPRGRTRLPRRRRRSSRSPSGSRRRAAARSARRSPFSRRRPRTTEGARRRPPVGSMRVELVVPYSRLRAASTPGPGRCRGTRTSSRPSSRPGSRRSTARSRRVTHVAVDGPFDVTVIELPTASVPTAVTSPSTRDGPAGLRGLGRLRLVAPADRAGDDGERAGAARAERAAR